MKNQQPILLVLGLLCGGVAFGAQGQTNETQQRAVEVLRKTIDSLDSKDKQPARKTPRAGHDISFAEAERLYLQGKISAKDFQQYLEDRKMDAAKLRNAEAQARALEVLRQELRKPEGNQVQPSSPVPSPDTPFARTNQAPATAPAEASTAAVPLTDQSNLEELEKRMDELLRLKAARDGATGTNAISGVLTNAATPPKPRTKRERLDELLRLVLEGKMTDAEYKEKRGKLMNEPGP